MPRCNRLLAGGRGISLFYFGFQFRSDGWIWAVTAVRDEILCHFTHNQDTRRYEGMTLPLRSTPAASLRKGDWKLIRFFADHPDGSDRFELYNLAVDPGELHDKTIAEPARFAKLSEILKNHLQDTGAIIPQRNPLSTFIPK